MTKQLFSEVVRAYRLSGYSGAARVIQKHYPEKSYQMAYDLAFDMLTEFVS